MQCIFYKLFCSIFLTTVTLLQLLGSWLLRYDLGLTRTSYLKGTPLRWGVSAQQISNLANNAAAVLQGDCRQNRGLGPQGRNAGHMVVIKRGAAEHSAYISMLPEGLRRFMKACASHGAQSAMLRVYTGRTKSWDMKQEDIFQPVCCIRKVYCFSMTCIKFEDFSSFISLHCKIWHVIKSQGWKDDRRTLWHKARNYHYYQFCASSLCNVHVCLFGVINILILLLLTGCSQQQVKNIVHRHPKQQGLMVLMTTKTWLFFIQTSSNIMLDEITFGW